MQASSRSPGGLLGELVRLGELPLEYRESDFSTHHWDKPWPGFWYNDKALNWDLDFLLVVGGFGIRVLRG